MSEPMNMTDDEIVDLLEKRLADLANQPRFRDKLLTGGEEPKEYNRRAQAVLDETLGALDPEHQDKIKDALDAQLETKIALLEWSRERRDRS